MLGANFSRVRPTPVAAPQLVAYSREVAQLLDLPPTVIETPAFAQVFVGNRLLDGMDPYATVTAGISSAIGQVSWATVARSTWVMSSIARRALGAAAKGAGPTPYSRTADGLAVLRSSIREFLCSEACITRRADHPRASLVVTGESVVRDML